MNKLSYKGTPLTYMGLDVWHYAKPGFFILVETGENGYKARFTYSEECTLKNPRGWTYGRDLDEVLDEVMKDERARLIGARETLERKEEFLAQKLGES